MYWAQASKAVAYRRYPYIVAENVACNPALDSGPSPLPGSSPDGWPVPVATDSCGWLGAIVNYHNWPSWINGSWWFVVGAVEIIRVGSRRKNYGGGGTACKYDTILDSWLTGLCC